MLICVVDTENNTPSDRFKIDYNTPIIEIGACIVNVRSGKVVAKFSELVDCGQQIYPNIVELTGITQAMIDENGRPLHIVMTEFWAWMAKHNCTMLAGWGKDADEVEKESKDLDIQPPRKLRKLDIKSMFMVLRCGLSNKKVKGGLKNTLETFGMEFIGRQHRGLTDSMNTARLLIHAKEIVNLNNMLKNHKTRELDIT